MSDQRLKIAVFIDFDNVEIGVKTTLGRQFDVGAVLEAVKERGEIITKIAYGDWKRAGDHSRTMAQHAVRLVQRVMTPGGDKNGADINLALDALEMAFTHDHINAFVIVGGDSDFITLVEKLKQYDKKVFVIGGRSFTSQVMQKNCTEFIAYENVAGSGGVDRTRSAPRLDRGRPGQSSLDQVLPLVQRALKVLADREVSPQLGLLKSTLLQLDSSFSERDYGASTFRDFAEKLEQQGLVTLKHSGRTTIVEMSENGQPGSVNGSTAATASFDAPTATEDGTAAVSPTPEFSLADGVALVRAVLAESPTPPRWPMYLRQMKQFIRTARPDFDERRYGSLPELLRACQKDGLLRLERDRQGGLRAFAGAARPTNVPHGWASLESVGAIPPGELDEAGEIAHALPGITPDEPPATLDAFSTAEQFDSPGESDSPGGADSTAVDAEADDQLAMFGAVSPMDPEPKVRKGRRSASETTKAKRLPARRAPRAAKAKSDAPRTRRRAGGKGRNED
jgi:NYN domain/OST-HTH/LOTUS domain